jgi:hypothetical protein
VTATAARRWVCSRCGVAVGQLDDREVPLPHSWESCADGDFCLSCRRGRAADAAQAAVPDETSTTDRAKARRAGLIEFEVRRTPDLTDGTIAKACRTSAAAVAAARKRLRMGDGPPPGSDGSWAAARRAAPTRG